MLPIRLGPTCTTLALSLLLGTGTAFASTGNTSEDKGEQTEAAYGVELLDMADDLARYGMDTSDAHALVQAARIKQRVAVEDMDAELYQSRETADAASKSGGDGDLSVDALLDQAEVLADGDEQLLAMIDETREQSASTRGRLRGPAHDVAIVHANDRNRYHDVVFRGGEHAVVTIAGDGDTDLDLYVYDENNNLICSSLSYSDRERCDFNPRWTGPFTIEVRNLGSVWNEYVLRTN